MGEIINNLKFDDKGLIPAIVQDWYTSEVLMLAYMNRESLNITIDEGKTCFYSRSRQELWRKGATSGNFQTVVSITADCDLDSLLIKVIKEGPACHTGKESCYFNDIVAMDKQGLFDMVDLYMLIMGRKTDKQEGSYTSYLFDKGKEKILKKVGEECTEVVIAGMKNDRKETIFEISDLAYHVLVLMAEMDIKPFEIKAELARRHVVDKKVKQETLK